MASQRGIDKMEPKIELTDEDKQLMTQYGVSCETRIVYVYKGYKYDQLHYALSYAKAIAEIDHSPVDIPS